MTAGDPGSGRRYRLYAWHLSYFAGKLRAYLTYKKIPFDDVPVSWAKLMGPIQRHTGARVMPVLRAPDGRWLQDTRCIIDELERSFPSPPIFPTTPRRRIAAGLIEAWGDEWWIPIAMHTRWTYAENYALFEREAGDALAPWAPRFVKDHLVGRVARMLRGYTPGVGIVPSQYAMMEEWSIAMLDLLDRHFTATPYLLGDHPTIADFGLQGTMYGHLGRDPWPKREWIDPRPALRGWIDRMATLDHDTVRAGYGGPTPAASAPGAPVDSLPATLEPVLRVICREFLPMNEAILGEVRRYLAAEATTDGSRARRRDRPLPRTLGPAEFPMGAHRFSRLALPFTLWKLQGVQDDFRALPADGQAAVRAWLRSLGGEGFLDLPIPRLDRVALRVRLAEAT
jgi:glutathione S-transferase